jgi:hypothetical protein
MRERVSVEGREAKREGISSDEGRMMVNLAHLTGAST